MGYLSQAIIEHSIPDTIHFAPNGKTILTSPIGYAGFSCTSAGLDKFTTSTLLALPPDADISARFIREQIESLTNEKVSVIITDSEGDNTFRGALTQPIGASGIEPIRSSWVIDQLSGKEKIQEENIVYFLANAAALQVGQRGRGIPLVIARNFPYTYNPDASLKDGLNTWE